MRKKFVKELRKIANELPETKVDEIQTEIVEGWQLIKEGIKEVQGKEVNPKFTYKRKKIVKVALNHENKLKQIFKTHGVNGVAQYQQAILDHQKIANIH